MKKLILILLVLLVISCDTNVITKYNTTDAPYDRRIANYVVREIREIGNKSYCEYKLTTGSDYLGYNDDIFIIDSIGKFNVRDTVYVNVVKKLP